MVTEIVSDKLSDYKGQYIVVTTVSGENFAVKILDADGKKLTVEGVTGSNKGKKIDCIMPEYVQIKVYDESSLVLLLLEL